MVTTDQGYTASTAEAGEVAQKLIELGFPLVPLRPVYFAYPRARGECNGNSPQCEVNGGGKHPCYVGWQTEQERARRSEFFDPFTWFRAPALGIGIVTGLELRPGKFLFIIDVDVADGKRGRESLTCLEQKLGTLPHTVTVKTGSGGMQFYFVTDVPLQNTQGKNKKVLAPGIDTRGVGGYGVAPPSMHKTGNRYEWLPGKAPWETAVAQLPDAWVQEVVALRADGAERAPKALRVPVSRLSFGTSKKIAVAVVTHPAWQWAKENPEDVDRMTWMGFASNLVAACDGHHELMGAARSEFHKLSRDYHRYSKGETDIVFEEAAKYLANGGGPHRWATMAAVPEDLKGHALNLVEDARRTAFHQV
jgi:hypothetical protein